MSQSTESTRSTASTKSTDRARHFRIAGTRLKPADPTTQRPNDPTTSNPELVARITLQLVQELTRICETEEPIRILDILAIAASFHLTAVGNIADHGDIPDSVDIYETARLTFEASLAKLRAGQLRKGKIHSGRNNPSTESTESTKSTPSTGEPE